MAPLKPPSHGELELGLQTQCTPVPFTGPHHTSSWQRRCQSMGLQGSGTDTQICLDVHFLERLEEAQPSWSIRRPGSPGSWHTELQ